VVTEYGLRAPLGWALSNAERHHVIARLTGSREAEREPDIRLTPTAVVDLGMVGSVGLALRWIHALAEQNSLQLRGATGGADYWRFSLLDRVVLGPRTSVGVRGEYLERGDWRFYGLGPLTRERDEQRLHWARADARFFVDYGLLEHAGLDLAMGLRADRFDTPMLTAPQQTTLPGYEDNAAFFSLARGFVDTRPRDAPNVSGARLEAGVEHDADLARRDRRWLRYDVEAAGFLEVMRPGRVLSLRAYAAFADALADAPVPLVDLATLGGFEMMRGWFVGRFRGESAAVFTLNYRYPVWYLLDGNVYVEAGNAFGRHLEGFDPRHLYGSAGLGFRTTGNRDASFDVIFAVGTSRFVEPFGIRSFRLAVGLDRGF
jgi:hypothetical protein